MAKYRKSKTDTRLFQIIPTKEEIKDKDKMKKKYGKKKCLVKKDEKDIRNLSFE